MIEAVGAEAGAEWDAYVGARPEATCYHLSGWPTLAERIYRLRVRRLVARASPGGPVRGVLPLIVVPRPFHRYVTTGIFGAYGPILADDAVAAGELLAAAARFTEEQRARYLHVKALGDGPAPPGLTRQDVWVIARLSLSGGPERVWKRFKTSMRAAIRQGLRSGLTLHAGPGELGGFYEVLAANMHRLGAPIYGLPFMRALLDFLGDRAEIVTLRAGGKPVSGALTVRYNGVMYVPFASSLASHFPLRPNNLLYWRLMERACVAGLGTFDFGSSLRGTSAFAFKLGWGPEVLPVASYLYATGPDTPRLDAGAPSVQAGVRLWLRLPRAATDALGPWVVRFMA